MSRILEQYRQRFPQDARTDEEIIIWLGTNYRELTTDAEFDREYAGAVQSVRKKFGDERTLVGEFTSGFGRGARGLAKTAVGGVALAADKLGLDGVSDKMLEFAGKPEERGSEAAFTFRQADSIGDYALATTAAIGEAAPSLIESIVTGLIGAGAGSAAAPGPGTVAGGVAGVAGKQAVKQTIKSQVRKQLERIAARKLQKQGVKEITEEALEQGVRDAVKQAASLGAMGLNSVGLNAGGIYSELRNSGTDRDTAANIALGSGIIAGGLDVITPGTILSRSGLLRSAKTEAEKEASTGLVTTLMDKFWARAVREGVASSATEAGTEFLQELIQLAAEKKAKAQSDVSFLQALREAPIDTFNAWTELTDEEFMQLRRAAELGAAGGALVGPLAAIRPSQPDAPGRDTPPTADPTATEGDSAPEDTIVPPSIQLSDEEMEIINRAVQLAGMPKDEMTAEDEIDLNTLQSRIFADPMMLKTYRTLTRGLAKSGKRINKTSEESKTEAGEPPATPPATPPDEQDQPPAAPSTPEPDSPPMELTKSTAGMVDRAVELSRRPLLNTEELDELYGLLDNIESDPALFNEFRQKRAAATDDEIARIQDIQQRNLEAIQSGDAKEILEAIAIATGNRGMTEDVTPPEGDAATDEDAEDSSAVAWDDFLQASRGETKQISGSALDALNQLQQRLDEEEQAATQPAGPPILEEQISLAESGSIQDAIPPTGPINQKKIASSLEEFEQLIGGKQGNRSVLEKLGVAGHKAKAQDLKPLKAMIRRRKALLDVTQTIADDLLQRQREYAALENNNDPKAIDQRRTLADRITGLKNDLKLATDKLRGGEVSGMSLGSTSGDVTIAVSFENDGVFVSATDPGSRLLPKDITSGQLAAAIKYGTYDKPVRGGKGKNIGSGEAVVAFGDTETKRLFQGHNSQKSVEVPIGVDEDGNTTTAQQTVTSRFAIFRGPDGSGFAGTVFYNRDQKAKKSVFKISVPQEVRDRIMEEQEVAKNSKRFTIEQIEEAGYEGVSSVLVDGASPANVINMSAEEIENIFAPGGIAFKRQEGATSFTEDDVVTDNDPSTARASQAAIGQSLRDDQEDLTKLMEGQSQDEIYSEPQAEEGTAETDTEEETDGEEETYEGTPEEAQAKVDAMPMLDRGIQFVRRLLRILPRIDDPREHIVQTVSGKRLIGMAQSLSGDVRAAADFYLRLLSSSMEIAGGNQYEVYKVANETVDEAYRIAVEKSNIKSDTPADVVALLDKPTFRRTEEEQARINDYSNLKPNTPQDVIDLLKKPLKRRTPEEQSRINDHVSQTPDLTDEKRFQELLAAAIIEEVGGEEELLQAGRSGEEETGGDDGSDAQGTPGDGPAAADQGSQGSDVRTPQVEQVDRVKREQIILVLRNRFEDTYNEETNSYDAAPEVDGIYSILEDMPMDFIRQVAALVGVDIDAWIERANGHVSVDGQKIDLKPLPGETLAEYTKRTDVDLDSFHNDFEEKIDPNTGALIRSKTISEKLYTLIGFDSVDGTYNEDEVEVMWRRVEQAQLRSASPARNYRQMIDAALFNLQQAGINIGYADLAESKLGAFLQFPDGQKMVALALADAVNPDSESLVSLFHEAAHAALAGESAQRRSTALLAIQSVMARPDGFGPESQPYISINASRPVFHEWKPEFKGPMPPVYSVTELVKAVVETEEVLASGDYSQYLESGNSGSFFSDLRIKITLEEHLEDLRSELSRAIAVSKTRAKDGSVFDHNYRRYSHGKHAQKLLIAPDRRGYLKDSGDPAHERATNLGDLTRAVIKDIEEIIDGDQPTPGVLQTSAEESLYRIELRNKLEVIKYLYENYIHGKKVEKVKVTTRGASYAPDIREVINMYRGVAKTPDKSGISQFSIMSGLTMNTWSGVYYQGGTMEFTEDGYNIATFVHEMVHAITSEKLWAIDFYDRNSQSVGGGKFASFTGGLLPHASASLNHAQERMHNAFTSAINNNRINVKEFIGDLEKSEIEYGVSDVHELLAQVISNGASAVMANATSVNIPETLDSARVIQESKVLADMLKEGAMSRRGQMIVSDVIKRGSFNPKPGMNVIDVVAYAIAGFNASPRGDQAPLKSGNQVRAKYRDQVDATENPEEMLVEAVARSLEAEGFNPSESVSFAQRIIEFIKEIYLTTAMWIQENILKRPASGKMATEWLAYRTKRLLRGDNSAISYSHWVGLPLNEQQAYFGEESVEGSNPIGSYFDPETQEWVHPTVVLDTIAGVKYRDQRSKEVVLPSADTTGQENRVYVAAQNEVLEALLATYRNWTEQGNNISNIGFEEFVSELGVNNPITIIQAINDGLTASGREAIDTNIRLSNLNEQERLLAASHAHQLLYGVGGKVNKIMAKEKIALDRSTKKLNRTIKKLSKLNREYTNVETLSDELITELRELMGDYRASILEVGQSGRRAGAIAQAVAELRKAEGRTPNSAENRAMASTIEATWKKWSASPEKFFDLVSKVESLDLNFGKPKDGGITISQFKKALAETGSTELTNTAQQPAELAILLGYMRKQSVLLDYLAMRRGKADERAEANKALRMAVNRSRNEVADALKIARRLPTIGIRLGKIIERISNVKEEMAAAERTVEALQTVVSIAGEAKPFIEQQQKISERLLGGTTLRWEPAHGAKYRVPRWKDGKLEWESKSLNLRSLEVGKIESVEQDLKAMARWLFTVPEQDRGVEWANTKLIFDKLNQIKANREHSAIRRLFGQKLFGTFVDRLRQVGTPAAREAAQKIRKYDSVSQAHHSEFENSGVRWSNALRRAMKASKWPMFQTKQFIAQVYEPALEYISRRDDLLAASNSEDEIAELAIKEIRGFLRTLPVWDQIKGAGEEISNLFRQTYRQSKRERDFAKGLDLKVRDDVSGLDYHLYRDHIGHPLMRVSRSFNSEAMYVYDFLRREGWGDKPLSRDVLEKRLGDEANLQGLAKEVNRLITPDVIRIFVNPIMNLSARSAFANPSDTARASVQNVKAAWRMAQGNVIDFALRLYEMESGLPADGDAAYDYVLDVLSTFSEYYGVLANQMREASDPSNTVSTESPSISQYMLSSRDANEMPSEWMTYARFDKHSSLQHMRQFAHHHAFGTQGTNYRSKENMQIFRLLDDVIREQGDIAGKYRNMIESDGMTPLQVKKMVGEEQYLVLKQAARNMADIKKLKKELRGFMEAHIHRDIEINSLYEVIGAMAGATVQGPGTPLIDTISTPEQALRKIGLNKDALRFIATAGKSMAGEAARTMLAAIGYNVQAKSLNHRRRMELGFYDSDSKLGFLDNIRAEMIRPIEIQNPIGKAAVRTARFVGAALNTGIGFRSEAAVTFKPHAAFTQVAQWLTHANIDAVWRLYDNFLAQSIQYLKEHPEYANPAHKLTENSRFKKWMKARNNLLFDNEKAFNWKIEAARDAGIDLDQIIWREFSRADRNQPSEGYTAEELRILAGIAKAEISKDTGLSTRPGFLLSSTPGAIANPLLGWSLSKTFEVSKGLRAPDLKHSWQAVAVGLKAYAAILPLGVAYALLRDKYDEEILGKKGNVIYLPGELGKMIKGEDHESGLALIDNLSRVGVFGMGGDMINNLMNVDTIRGGGLGIERRVFVLSNLIAIISSMQTLWKQSAGMSPKDFLNAYSWETVGRPLFSGMGGSGYLQYVDAMENAFEIGSEEGKVAARININNLLRAAGRVNGIEVRQSGGASLPTPAKVHVKAMLLAALANNPSEFQTAYAKALAAGEAMGKEDPADFVKRSFQGVHPLRNLFKNAVTPEEIEQLLSSMSPDSRRAVREAIYLINQYGAQLGIPAFNGSEKNKKKKKRRSSRAIDYRLAAASF